MSSFCFYLYILLTWLINCKASPAQVLVNKLKCNKNMCEGLNFPRDTEVAYFTNEISQQLRDYKNFKLGNCHLANFPLNVFKAFNQLDYFSVYKCGVQHVAAECFEGAENLKVLILSNNLIENIDEQTFASAKKLEELDLAENKLQQLPSKAFAALTKLKNLHLQGNDIKMLPDNIFTELKQLRQINLDNNQLRKLPKNVCANQQELQLFSARNNLLKEVAADAFSTVQQLILSDNAQLHKLNFKGKIYALHAENCPIQSLEFEQPMLLKQLILGNTTLQSLGFLQNTKNLLDLDLSGVKQLPALPKPWLAKNLEHLSLSQTNSSVWPADMLAQLPKLKYLDRWQDEQREIYIKDLNTFDLNRHYVDDYDWMCGQLELLVGDMVLNNPVSILNIDKDRTSEYYMHCPRVEELDVDELVWNGSALERLT